MSRAIDQAWKRFAIVPLNFTLGLSARARSTLDAKIELGRVSLRASSILAQAIPHPRWLGPWRRGHRRAGAPGAVLASASAERWRRDRIEHPSRASREVCCGRTPINAEPCALGELGLVRRVCDCVCNLL